MVTHFHSIATTVNPTVDMSMIDLIPNCLNDEDNKILCATPNMIEIKNIVFSMEPDKSRFPPSFFQQN